jgi:hypothetical protein
MRRRESAEPAATAATRPAPLVSGQVAVRRARLLRYPSYRMRTEAGLEVGVARYSALNIYFFGRGQKITLPWGERWRQTAVARGSGLAAVLLNGARQRLVMAAAGAAAGNYGIVGRDYAYTLNPAQGGFGRSRRWDLYHGEEIVARFTRRPFGGVCLAALPLPVVLLCLQLTRFGIPGENELRLPGMYQRMHGGG